MRVKLSRDAVRSDLVRKIEDISGETLMKCYQCGKCSAGCPAIEEMDLLPSEVIRLAQMGCIDEIIEANTIWLCASCFTCQVRCPKGIDLARVMEALRLILLRKNIDKLALEEINEEEYRELPQIALVSALRKKTA